MRKWLFLLFLIFLCMGVGKGLYLLKDGFSARRIHSLEDRVIEDWGLDVDLVLAQPFYYIGRGRQCFAFASQDEKYVLKIPRTDIYKTPLWARVLPVRTYRKKLQTEHLQREQFILDSFRISFHELKNQTGLLAIHLGQSASKGKKLILIDKFGCNHRLPLEKTPFVLQWKRPILMKVFSRALQKGDRKEAERILDALVDVIVERARKGILNRDRSFLRNYGFDGQKAYQIDAGSFFHEPKLDPKAAYRKSLFDSMDPIEEWLAKKDLKMLAYLQQRLQKEI